MNESYTVKGTALDFKSDNAWLSTRVVIDISEQTLDKLSKILSPVQHGYWEDSSNGWTCSICGRDVSKDYNYCPHCGAQMDKEREENE